jgi:hypothetical protein
MTYLFSNTVTADSRLNVFQRALCRACSTSIRSLEQGPLLGLGQATYALMETPAAKRACTTFEQEAPPAYFAGTPADFQAAAVVVLQLRGGVHLPAHSQLLASTSPILCDLLKLAASQAPTGSKAVIPLDEFSELEATDVLKVRVPLMCAVQVNLARELGSGKANS